jgi:hypothetical protein
MEIGELLVGLCEDRCRSSKGGVSRMSCQGKTRYKPSESFTESLDERGPGQRIDGVSGITVVTMVISLLVVACYPPCQASILTLMCLIQLLLPPPPPPPPMLVLLLRARRCAGERQAEDGERAYVGGGRKCGLVSGQYCKSRDRPYLVFWGRDSSRLAGS